jgi:hypothetical protein
MHALAPCLSWHDLPLEAEVIACMRCAAIQAVEHERKRGSACEAARVIGGMRQVRAQAQWGWPASHRIKLLLLPTLLQLLAPFHWVERLRCCPAPPNEWAAIEYTWHHSRNQLRYRKRRQLDYHTWELLRCAMPSTLAPEHDRFLMAVHAYATLAALRVGSWT